MLFLKQTTQQHLHRVTAIPFGFQALPSNCAGERQPPEPSGRARRAGFHQPPLTSGAGSPLGSPRRPAAQRGLAGASRGQGARRGGQGARGHRAPPPCRRRPCPPARARDRKTLRQEETRSNRQKASSPARWASGRWGEPGVGHTSPSGLGQERSPRAVPAVYGVPSSDDSTERTLKLESD